MSEDALVVELERIKQSNGWSYRHLARELGIDHGLLSRIRSGEQRPGRVTLQKIMVRFPELTPHVLLFLQSNVSDSHIDVDESRVA